jgi:hypothetical protein
MARHPEGQTMTVDYKSTIHLPRTDFPMKAGLPKREPEILARWEEMGLWRRLREESAGREKFILHDGPPYANGHLHIGHALNKILKDVINRSQQMLGKDANYVPGWDCHGLPIEWKIEEQYREAGKDKDAVPIVEFRKECRDFAAHWIGVQRAEFERLGVVGDWQNPYTTMAYAAEAQIAREIGAFLLNGGLFRGAKPVLWSVVERTALAEAEVEYHDVSSPTIHVRFPVVQAGDPALDGAAVIIWTTTPWTMPGNRAVAYGEYFDYLVIEVTEAAEGSLARAGERIVIATALLEQVLAGTGITGHTVHATLKGTALAGTVCAHPLRGQGYDFDVPLLSADFVTADDGTGFVHIAPGHGADDFVLGSAHGIEAPETVGEDGVFYDHVPLFAGKTVYTAEGKPGDITGAVIGGLIEAGGLLAKGRLKHSYPHSWRSKAPLIFRNTTQWFISMETNDLRKKALKAIEDTAFDDRDAPRLVHLAPTGLGRADPHLRGEEDRRAAARREGRGPGGRRLRGGGRGCLVLERAGAFPRQRLQSRRLRTGARRRRCVVRFRLDPRFRPGSAGRLAMAGVALPGGLGPASRLVPFVVARGLRYPRPCALRRGADAWVRHGRGRAQDVQVAGQRRLAASSRRTARRGNAPPLGRCVGLFRRPPHRSGDHQVSGRRLSAAAQYAALPAGQPRRVRCARPRRNRRYARVGALGAASPLGDGPRGAALRRGIRFPRHVPRAA